MLQPNGRKVVRVLVIVLILGSLFLRPAATVQAAINQFYFKPSRYYTISDEKALLQIQSDADGMPKHRVIWKDPAGTTVSCGPECHTQYLYSPNGVVVGSIWDFYIYGNNRSIGVYTAVIETCTNYSTITQTCLAWAQYATIKFFISPNPDPEGPFIAKVPVDENSYDIAVNPTTNRVYVTHYQADSVSVIDGASNTVIDTVLVSGDPSGVAVHPATSKVYVGHDQSVSVIDGTSNTITKTLAMGAHTFSMAVNPTTNRVYVVGAAETWGGKPYTMTIINTATDAIVNTIDLGSVLGEVAVNPATNRIYVTSQYSDTVTVFNGATDAIVTTITVGKSPEGIGVNPVANRVYVTNFPADSISIIDGANNTVIKTIPLTFSPAGIGVNPTTNHIFVANIDGVDVTKIDGASSTIIDTVNVSTSTWLAAVNPTTNRIYMTNRENFVLVIQDEPVEWYNFLPMLTNGK